ncbi:hypothetical protein SNE40_002868 [Patella caerulea]
MRNNVKRSNPLLADKEGGIPDLSSIGKLTPMRISPTRSELENNLCINITSMRLESTPKINSQPDVNIRCDNITLSPHRTPDMTEICSPTVEVQDNSVSDASMHTIDMIGVCNETCSPVQVENNSASDASRDRIATDNSGISTPNIQPKGKRKLKRRKIISTRIGNRTCTQQEANSGDDFLKTAIQLLQDSVKTLSTEKQELMSVIADMKQTITEHDRALEDMKLKIKEQGNELKDIKSKVKPQPTNAKDKPETAKCMEGNNVDNIPNKTTATKPKEPHIHIDTNRNQINQSTISTNNRFVTPSDETNRKHHTEYYKYPSVEPRHHIINKTNVVIGFSIIKYIIPRRLDPSGSTFTKTLRGAKIRDVLHYINNCAYNDNVLNVVFLVGSNDSSLRTVEHCRQDYMQLIQDTRAIFPNAKIKFLTLLPRDSVAKNGKLNIINRILKDVTNFYSWELIDAREKFYDFNRCCIKKGLYEDPVHINAYGTAILVRVIKCHIYLWSELDETSNYLQTRLRSNYLNEPRDISVHDTPHHSTRDNTCNR